MKVLELEIKGSYLFHKKVFKDSRGKFFESYNKSIFNFLKINFIQDNIALSNFKNTFRGLHYQNSPYEQNKLISVLNGKIIDILIDLRVNSPSYNKIVEIELESYEKSIYIPAGVAHGYITLEDNSLVMYKVDNIYSPKHEGGLNINHIFNKLKSIDIKKDELIMSDKDRNLK